MAASIAENTPSKTMDSDPDSSPNSTPHAATTIVTPIDSLRICCSAAAACMSQRSAFGRSDREDQAGRGAVRQKPARRVVELALGGGDARADVDDASFGRHLPGLLGHGAHVVDL